MTTRRAKGPRADAARRRLDQLAADFNKAATALETAREALAAGIVEILRDGDLGPSEVTEHVPYDRQHVGRIAKVGGVEPRRRSAKQRGAGEDGSS